MRVLLRLPTPQSSAFCSLWFSRCPLRVCSSKAAHLLRATTMRHPSSGESGGGESGWLPTRSTSRHCWKHVRITHTHHHHLNTACASHNSHVRVHLHIKTWRNHFIPRPRLHSRTRTWCMRTEEHTRCHPLRLSALFHLWLRVRVCSQGLPRQVLWIQRVTPTAPCSSVGWHLKPTRRSCSGSSNRTGPFPR